MTPDAQSRAESLAKPLPSNRHNVRRRDAEAPRKAGPWISAISAAFSSLSGERPDAIGAYSHPDSSAEHAEGGERESPGSASRRLGGVFRIRDFRLDPALITRLESDGAI
jgi:transposase